MISIKSNTVVFNAVNLERFCPAQNLTGERDIMHRVQVRYLIFVRYNLETFINAGTEI